MWGEESGLRDSGLDRRRLDGGKYWRSFDMVPVRPARLRDRGNQRRGRKPARETPARYSQIWQSHPSVRLQPDFIRIAWRGNVRERLQSENLAGLSEAVAYLRSSPRRREGKEFAEISRKYKSCVCQ